MGTAISAQRVCVRACPAPPALVALGQSVLFDHVEINRSTEVQPRSDARTSLNLPRRNLSIDVQAARYGEFTVRWAERQIRLSPAFVRSVRQSRHTTPVGT